MAGPRRRTVARPGVLGVSEMAWVAGLLGMPGQVDLLDGVALGCGRCAGWPQRGQQQRRLAQV